MTSNVQLSKLGILTNAFIKIVIKGVKFQGTHNIVSTVATEKHFHCSKWLAPAIVESIKLSSHSRELSKLTSLKMCEIMNNMPLHIKNTYKQASGFYVEANTSALNPEGQPASVTSGEEPHNDTVYGIHAQTISVRGEGQIVVYLPVLFTPLRGSRKNCLWTSFCETLDIGITTRKRDDWLRVRDPTTPGISTPGTDMDIFMMGLYHILDPQIYKASLNANFKLGASLQVMWSKSVLIGKQSGITPTPAFSAALATAPRQKHTFTIATTSTELVRSFSIYCYSTAAAPGSGGDYAAWTNGKHDAVLWSPDLLEITQVKFEAGGRTMFDINMDEARLLSTTIGNGVDVSNPTSSNVQEIDLSNNAFNYSFASGVGEGRYQGGCALSGLSSQSFEVTCVVTSAATINCEIFTNSVDVKSLSSNDGRWLTSLSV